MLLACFSRDVTRHTASTTLLQANVSLASHSRYSYEQYSQDIGFESMQFEGLMRVWVGMWTLESRCLAGTKNVCDSPSERVCYRRLLDCEGMVEAR